MNRSTALCNLLFELGHLRRIKHEGWRLAGVDHPESVAEHCLRAAQIGYILAELEGYDRPEEVCAMLVFHDISECRTGDLHKLGKEYTTRDEERAVRDQVKELGALGEKIFSLWDAVEKETGVAGVIARDADELEQATLAKELLERGYGAAQQWLDNVEKVLRTNSARTLFNELLTMKSYEWWYGR